MPAEVDQIVRGIGGLDRGFVFIKAIGKCPLTGGTEHRQARAGFGDAGQLPELFLVRQCIADANAILLQRLDVALDAGCTHPLHASPADNATRRGQDIEIVDLRSECRTQGIDGCAERPIGPRQERPMIGAIDPRGRVVSDPVGSDEGRVERHASTKPLRRLGDKFEDRAEVFPPDACDRLVHILAELAVSKADRHALAALPEIDDRLTAFRDLTGAEDHRIGIIA